MDILGVGGWEILAILIIMLIVAGPKRMITWSYQLGKYISALRKMWSETAVMLQKEFDEAGVDVQVPKDIPTRNDLNREIGRALTPMAKPFQESMAATQKELDNAKQSISISSTAAPTPPKPLTTPEANSTTNGNGNGSGHVDFGTWSQIPKDDQ